MADIKLKTILDVQDKATTKVKGFETSLAKLTSGVALGTIAANAFSKSVSFLSDELSKSIKAFSTQEMADARLRAGLKNTTKEWEDGFNELTKYASSLQKTTTFADEQIVSGQAMLSTFMLNKDEIKKLTPSLLDMAAALANTEGGTADLQQMSILLGKAIGGEDVAGLSGALRRVGIIMTDTQTKILEVGTKEERLNEITKIVAQNFGGFAAESANTYTGKLQIMQNSIDDVREKFGEALLKGLAPFIEKLTIWIQTPEAEKFINNLSGAINGVTDTFMELFGTVKDFVIPIFKEQFKETLDILNTALTQLNLNLQGAGDKFNMIDLALSPLIGLVIVFNKTLQVSIGFMAAMKVLAEGLATVFTAIVNSLKWIASAPSKVFDILGAVKGIKNFGANLVGERATGGYVQSGQQYLVGEAGPELFVPSSSGRIVPNGQSGANISVNFNNPTVRSDADLNTIKKVVIDTLTRQMTLEKLRV